jgi:polyhydroxyalkanoate synthesis repressor PhaR
MPGCRWVVRKTHMSQTVRIIKKYPNRRLYDTQTSSYITLHDVKQLVLGHEDFQVVDAKSAEDLTRGVLLQIILEEEAGAVPMFSSDMLSQIIRFYGHAMQGMMGNYLEKNLEAFNEITTKIQDQSKALYGEPAKSNAELWAQFMNFQTPAIQGAMSAYMEQSKNMFLQMQEQLQSSTRNMFSGFPFPGFPGGAPGADGKPGETKAETAEPPAKPEPGKK